MSLKGTAKKRALDAGKTLVRVRMLTPFASPAQAVKGNKMVTEVAAAGGEVPMSADDAQVLIDNGLAVLATPEVKAQKS